jgi:SRSO17 transposase
MPEQWFTEDDKDRRDTCTVPQDVTLHTKPPLAVEMVQAIRRETRLPFKYIVADCLYGNRPDFLDALDAWVGVTALGSIPADTRCWLPRPLTTENTYAYTGEVRAKRVVAPATQAPITVEALAQSLASSCWYRRTVSEGTKGPIAYAFARQRVTRGQEGLPDRTGWLVIQRTLGASPTYAYSLSKAPASPPLRLFVWLSGVRWAIEQGFEDTQTALGMAHYAGRTSPGWPHHILTGMLAHFFRWHLPIRLGKKSPSADGGTGADLAGSALALAHVHGGGCPRAGGVGPAVQSPGV